MAVTYVASLKTTRLNSVVSAIGTTGDLEIGTAGMAEVLVKFDLANPAGTVSGDELTFSFVSASADATATGAAAAARVRTGAAADVITGLTVGTAATDIILNSTSITDAQQVTVTSAVITHG